MPYHVVVSASGGPAIHEAAYVPVDGVDVGSRTVDVVHEAWYRLALWSPTVDAYLSGVPYLVAVGVVTSQIDQEIGVVPFLHFQWQF